MCKIAKAAVNEQKFMNEPPNKAKNGEDASATVGDSTLFKTLPSLLTAREIPNAREISFPLANQVDKIDEMATVRFSPPQPYIPRPMNMIVQLFK